MFHKVNIRVDKVIKGEGPVGRMWESWGSEKAWFTEKTNTQTFRAERPHQDFQRERTWCGSRGCGREKNDTQELKEKRWSDPRH